MHKLIETLQQKDATFNDLLNCLEKITSLGDACLLKMDGKRSTGWITIVIYFHSSTNQESIRYDSSDFRDVLIKALQEYVSVKGLDQ